MARRRSQRGVTLLEVLVSVGILALIGSLIYGAFDGMSRARTSLSRMDDRYHQGRQAMARLSRELQSAFISLHKPPIIQNAVRNSVFIGTNSNPADRIDFCTFAHRRLGRDLHESDQSEISYFVSRDPENRGKLDLARREQKEVDIDPQHGGVVNVAAEDIVSFDVTYLDPLSGEWVETWDSVQPAAQLNRLPLQVKVVLVLNGGVANQPITLTTKVPISMQGPLSFAAPNATNTEPQ
jgi:general secretion pathway protein J